MPSKPKGSTSLETIARYNKRRRVFLTGFTYIELLITLIVMAICIVPIMRMFSVLTEQVYSSGEITTALYLGKEGMEKTKNLGFTKQQFIVLGDIYDPPLTEPALELNQNTWRVLRYVKKDSDPLEISILVFNTKNPKKPVLEFVTLIEDLEWNPVSEEE